MATFGTSLREEREARGIALEEIASATRIGRRYLEALEENDLARLPGGVFNRGFVRAYAQFIGLDPDEVVEAYTQEEQAQGLGIPDSEAMIEEMARLVDRRAGRRMSRFLPVSPMGRGLLLISPLLVLAAAGWFALGRGAASGPQAPAETSPTSVEAMTPPRTSSGADSVSTPNGTPVIRVEDRLAVVSEDSGRRDSTTSSTTVMEPTPSPATPPSTTAASVVPVPALPVGVPTSRVGPAAGEEARLPPAVSVPTVPAPSGSQTDAVDPATTVTSSGLSVHEFGVGTAVIDRRLVGKSDRFVEGSRVHFWTRAVDGKAGDRLRHVWIHDGRIVATVELTIGGPHWRTHSRKTLFAGANGPWAVEAQDASGRVLARQQFICTPASSEPPAAVSSRQRLEKLPGGRAFDLRGRDR